MAVDIAKLFREDLPAAMAKNPEQVRAIGARYLIAITGEGGGEWFIDASRDGTPSVTSGSREGADCTIRLSAEDFQRLYENPAANGPQLFFAGKIQVSGNPMLAMKLQQLFGLS